MISKDVIQQVKESNDIVDVISERVRLKRSGRYYMGLCPFHNEKTPSFTVTPDKQIYKCFGCGEAGNVITFVMKTRNLPFVDAVHLLADRANIEVTYENGETPQKDAKEELYKINVDAARYFFNNLRRNKKALNYLHNRGLLQKTINNFGIGYAEDRWDGLLTHLKKKGYTELDMLSAGLIIRGNKGNIYDRFRNRIIFPVFDYRGRVIGFGGRVLDDSKPKYLNSPETLVFKKGTNLYGINFAINNNINNNINNMFIIVEGYMDCIALHQCGITSAVASLGTALTPNQAKLLKRYCNKVIISYDADLAGQKATQRGLDVLKSQALDVRVIMMPKGEDPDDFIKKHGKEAFLELIDKALQLIDYKLQKASEGINLKEPQGVIKYVKRAINIIKDLQPIEREIYIKRLSEETKLESQVLYDLLNNKLKKDVNNNINVNIEEILGNKLYLEPSYIKAERVLIKSIIESEFIKDYIFNNIKVDEFILKSHRDIINIILENYDLGIEEIKNNIEINYENTDIIKEWINIQESKKIGESDNYKVIVQDFIKEIKKYKLEEKIKKIKQDIKKFESEGNIEKSLGLAQELINIQRKLSGTQ
ncbi:DNA primase [Clostridium cochlearium]|uniref:DNA primase n=1 Tax=Clostridium cochlearium TaxID=1494 RepID=A0A7Y3XWE7_CLOCO|nr:DNA primase [Clostridium cochlearium]NOH15709.1 DNA primase [Clostridium cochlearium]